MKCQKILDKTAMLIVPFFSVLMLLQGCSKSVIKETTKEFPPEKAVIIIGFEKLSLFGTVNYRYRRDATIELRNFDVSEKEINDVAIASDDVDKYLGATYSCKYLPECVNFEISFIKLDKSGNKTSSIVSTHFFHDISIKDRPRKFLAAHPYQAIILDSGKYQMTIAGIQPWPSLVLEIEKDNLYYLGDISAKIVSSKAGPRSFYAKNVVTKSKENGKDVFTFSHSREITRLYALVIRKRQEKAKAYFENYPALNNKNLTKLINDSYFLVTKNEKMQPIYNIVSSQNADNSNQSTEIMEKIIGFIAEGRR